MKNITTFGYKQWEIRVWEGDGSRMFKWTAYGPQNVKLGDTEGGELINLKYAKQRIKMWIDEYERDPIAFKFTKSELCL
jgi:hypothetical protein